ncbi:hypothetical protein RYX36_009742 [Vicia faba]
MASGATCVQRLDGSRDSAIHTKYRISLRSSSMQEPRYPLPRVILYHVSKHNPHENRLRCHAGALRAKFKFLDAFSSGGLSFGAEENALRRPPPNQRSAEWTSHNVAGSGPPTSPQSEHFTGPFNRGVLKETSADPWSASFMVETRTLELPRLLAPDLPSNGSSLRDLDCTHSNYQTQ